METKHLFLLPALAFLACTGLQAQVTIGGLVEPAAGAVLDLNSGGAKGGLLLSNVTLPDLTTIPYNSTNAFPGVDNNNKEDVKSQFRGAIVYHTGGNDIAAGVYVWNGKWWTPADGTPVNIVKDAQGNDYTTGYFGDAGWWMTQNLRTTNYAYVDGIQTSLVKKTDAMTSGSLTEPRYTFPGTGTGTSNASAREAALTSEQLKAYGLLYNWVAASGRKENANNDNTENRAGYGSKEPAPGLYYRGVCPEGWHLPSDYEWSQLEIEIATNPGKYSTQEDSYTFPDVNYGNLYTNNNWRPAEGNTNQPIEATYWGRQMKRMAGAANIINGLDPKGSSKSREEGAFDVLLVGIVYAAGNAGGYGSNSDFWSSSSHDTYGVHRGLRNDYTGVSRFYGYKGYLFSVRCKKD
jgi:uncharacterized protein (TIGR02145 family)